MLNFEGWCYKKNIIDFKIIKKKFFGEYLYREDYL